MAVSNIVCEWLRALGLAQYAESFLDNGYDDLEICKQVGDPDLDAIGVENTVHRHKLLKSIRQLREKGAASVYFMLNDPTSFADSTEILCETPPSELDLVIREQLDSDGVRLTTHPYSTPDGQRGHLEGLASVYCELLMAPFGDILSALEVARQAAWAERSPMNPAGGSGSSGSASGSASGSGSGSGTSGHIGTHRLHGHRGSSNHTGGLPNSHSQPIYVPGKYSPSSCLSDKEEDEIYGFGYGVFAPRVARGALTQQQQLIQQQTLQQQAQISQQQQQLQMSSGGVTSQVHHTMQHNHQQIVQPNSSAQHLNFVQQNCLSPRSAYFYEFPPSAEGREHKKRTTLVRLLKGLKTVNRRERHHHHQQHNQQQLQQHLQQQQQHPLQQFPTMANSGGTALLQVRAINCNESNIGGAAGTITAATFGNQQQSFEETIHRLKVQEALRKKERFQREHEQVLRDIRQGLLQMSCDGSKKGETYLYNDVLRQHPHYALRSGLHGAQGGHWYDEPPYESDPDDFLMAGLNCGAGPAATIQGGRVRYTSNCENTGVISLRSAGDISLPQRGPPRRGLIVPQQPPNPPTIIPLTHARSHDRESGDYAGSISDLQSVTSRLSTISITTNNCTAHYRTLSGGVGESPSLSPSQSSDYEDIAATRDLPLNLALKSKKNGHLINKQNTISQKATIHHKAITASAAGKDKSASLKIAAGVKGVGSLSGRDGNFLNENGVQSFVTAKDISREFSNSQENTDRGSISDQAFVCSASSMESLPSASGSSTQALVRPGSPNSSISADDRFLHKPVVICKARAIAESGSDYPYEREALRFKKGDIIDVLSMNASGIWKGRCHGRVGHFRFIKVEVLPDQRLSNHHNTSYAKCFSNILNSTLGSTSVIQTLTSLPASTSGVTAHSPSTLNPVDSQALCATKSPSLRITSSNTANSVALQSCEQPSLTYATSQLQHFSSVMAPIGNNECRSTAVQLNGPHSVEDLLMRIGLKEYTTAFVLNGYEDLDLFKELEPADLDYLGILNAEHRAKLITAVQLLHDLESSTFSHTASSDGDIAGSSSENDDARLNNSKSNKNGTTMESVSNNGKKHSTSPFGRRHFPRDSGCYEGSPVPSAQTPTQLLTSMDASNSLDDVVTKCSSEIMKRVESARRQKENPFKSTHVALKTTRVSKKNLLGDESTARSGNGSNSNSGGGGGGLSEKSSDSGVSSSSLSSGPLKNST